MEGKIRLGISSCLLGNKVRYNGGHQHDRFLTETLGRYVDFVPVCPEVECGLGIPRETMHLEGDATKPRLITSKTGIDHTERMVSWAKKRVMELAREDLHGFIFKSRSPSSGMERIGVVGADNIVRKTGVGLFAREFMAQFPLMPVEDDGRLHDIGLRENFIERIFVIKRWRDLKTTHMTRGGLVDFHTRHKLLIMSHSEKHYRDMGRLVSQAKTMPLESIFDEYEKMLMTGLRYKTTVKKNINVLLHMLGYFKKSLSGDEKMEVLEIIEQYRNETIPLIVPMTLFNHFIRKYGVEYLRNQYYLAPHPIELKLRNHA